MRHPASPCEANYLRPLRKYAVQDFCMESRNCILPDARGFRKPSQASQTGRKALIKSGLQEK
jgi:hypothetical protein